MLRKARVKAPGAIHHSTRRGIEHKKILSDDADRDKFLERVGDILLESSTQCYDLP